jgi:YD repeat-containing protein
VRHGEREEGPLMRRAIGMAALAMALAGAAMGQALTCGTPAAGSFANGTFDYYAIQAQPGDTILVRMQITSKDTSFVPKMVLLDSGNHAIAGTAALATGAGMALGFSLANGGQYLLGVQNSSATTGAAYLVVFTYLNRGCTGTLACGAGMQGALATFEIKSYQFAVNARDVVSTRWVRMAPFDTVTVGTGATARQISFTPLVAVYSPSGTLLNSGSSGFAVTAPAAGLLTVLVLDPNSLTGNFVLSMLTINRPCGGNTLSCGAVTQGNIAAALNVQAYGIQMNSGDLGVLRTTAAPGSSLGPVLELYDPAGRLLNSGLSVGFQAATSGVYTLVIRDGPVTTLGTRTGAFVASLLFFNRPCASQTALSCPYIVDGTISGMLGTNAYTLNAQAKDVLLVRLAGGAGGSLFQPSFQIFDQAGNQVANLSTKNGNTVRQTVTIPSAGSYTVFVSDSSGTQSGSYTFSTLPLNRPCNPTGLSCGAVAGGALARTLDAGVYSYTAAAGESFSVRMFDPTGVLQPDLEVFDPAGNPVGQSIAANYTGVDVVRPAGGAYTVVAMDSSARPTGAPFTLALLRTVNACAASAAQGQTVSGVITAGVPFVSYSLPAAAGDVLLVRSTSTTLGFAAQMELYDATGARVDSQTYGVARKATAAGNFTVIVGASAPKTGGGYALSWQLLNNPAATAPLACGGAANGPLAGAGQFQWYSAAANAGDVLRLLLTRTSDNFSPQVDVYDPAGARLAPSSLDITAAAKLDGSYLVAVGPASSSAENGTYSLAFQRPNNPCTPTVLTCGQAALRKVTVAGQLDAFTLNGTGGDRENIKLMQRSGGYTPFGELYDASGKLLTAGAGGTLLANLAASGTYTLLVRDTRGTTLGSYRVAVQDDTNACAVTDTTAPAVTLMAPTGGEAIGGGTTYQIQWQSDDNVGVAAQTVSLSTDGGQTWTPIVSALGGNQQSYVWAVPANVAPTRTAMIQVTATDAAGNAGSAASGAVTLIGAGFTPNTTATYGYDSLNRLVQATLSDGRVITYTYDAAGNLVAVTVGR